MAIRPPVQGNITPLIRRLAPQFRIDPRAAIAVAMGEGGLQNREGDVGDLAGGGSYGPFQLYAQGALPRRFVGNPQAADAWAWSPEGIKYALSRMQAAGAGGLTGRAAVETIIRKFERPAAPDKSVAAALARLGNMPMNTPANMRATPALSQRSYAGVLSDSQPQSTQRNPIANALLQGLASGQDVYDIIQTLPALSGAGGNRTPVSSVKSRVPHHSATAPMNPTLNPGSPNGGFGVRELIYDPMGSIFDGVRSNKPYGGHGSHVHYAGRSPQDVLRAIDLATRLGLSVRENPFTDPVDPVHTEGSHHYRTFKGKYRGRTLGEAIDVSGNPQKLTRLYRTLAGLK